MLLPQPRGFSPSSRKLGIGVPTSLSLVAAGNQVLLWYGGRH
jgi:hypothetical protein